MIDAAQHHDNVELQDLVFKQRKGSRSRNASPAAAGNFVTLQMGYPWSAQQMYPFLDPAHHFHAAWQLFERQLTEQATAQELADSRPPCRQELESRMEHLQAVLAALLSRSCDPSVQLSGLESAAIEQASQALLQLAQHQPIPSAPAASSAPLLIARVSIIDLAAVQRRLPMDRRQREEQLLPSLGKSVSVLGTWQQLDSNPVAGLPSIRELHKNHGATWRRALDVAGKWEQLYWKQHLWQEVLELSESAGDAESASAHLQMSSTGQPSRALAPNRSRWQDG